LKGLFAGNLPIRPDRPRADPPSRGRRRDPAGPSGHPAPSPGPGVAVDERRTIPGEGRTFVEDRVEAAPRPRPVARARRGRSRRQAVDRAAERVARECPVARHAAGARGFDPAPAVAGNRPGRGFPARASLPGGSGTCGAATADGLGPKVRSCRTLSQRRRRATASIPRPWAPAGRAATLGAQRPVPCDGPPSPPVVPREGLPRVSRERTGRTAVQRLNPIPSVARVQARAASPPRSDPP
jgi:hypothetical protein